MPFQTRSDTPDGATLGGASRRTSEWLVAGAAAVLSVLLYASTLDNPFVYDDFRLIVENPAIQTLSDIRTVMVRDITRPLVNLTYISDTAVWGTRPFGYHLTNIVLHALSVIAMFWVAFGAAEDWRATGGGGAGGGSVTTAGNLVFQVINDGRLMAYSADKGEKLLEIQTGLRGGMAPPITYIVDGKQYVSFMGGTGQAGGGGGGANAGPPPVRPKLLTFTLDGKELLPQ